MSMDLYTKVRMMMSLTNTTNKTLALSIGANQNGFPQKLKNGRLTIKEKKTIAKAANCEYVAKFIFPDGTEFEADNLKDILELSCNHAGITMRRLTYEFRIVKDNMKIKTKKLSDSELENVFEALGIENVFFNFYSSRLKREKFTDSEIEQLAAILGAEYQNYFILPDNSRI